MASTDSKNLNESKQNTKENYKNRKISGVPNWLKKHTKWGRKGQTNIPSDRKRMSSHNILSEETLTSENGEKRKEVTWKKDLDSVCSSNSSILKTNTSDPLPSEALFNFCNPPFNSFYCLPQLPLLQMALMNSPDMVAGCSYLQQPGTSLQELPSSDACYFQQPIENMGFVEHLQLQQFIIANLHQAALAEQARVAAAVLQQAYMAYGLNPILDKCHSEPMDYHIRSEDMEIDQPLSDAPSQLEKSFKINERQVFDLTEEQVKQRTPVCAKTYSLSDSNQKIQSESLVSSLKQVHQSSDKNNSELFSPNQLCQKNSSITTKRWSPKQLKCTTNCINNISFAECSSENTINGQNSTQQREKLRKMSPEDSTKNGNVHPPVRKRLKRNAISAEPSSYNKMVAASGFFNNPISLAVPKPLK